MILQSWTSILHILLFFFLSENTFFLVVGFHLPANHQKHQKQQIISLGSRQQTKASFLFSNPTYFHAKKNNNDDDDIDDDMVAMREEIDNLREEALRRIDALSDQLAAATSSTIVTAAGNNDDNDDEPLSVNEESATSAKTAAEAADSAAITPVPSAAAAAVPSASNAKRVVSNDTLAHHDPPSTTTTTTTTTAAAAVMDENNNNNNNLPTSSSSPELFSPKMIQQIKTTDAILARSELELLDGTQWKVMLNIGREPGTWMPKTWGVSNERLLINLIVEFTPDQFYERDDFLAGVGGARILRVINEQATLSPSLSEGCKTIQCRNGGWRIAPGSGPLGTDIVRFFVEFEENVQHSGSDVYCPAGRVYCTCGYFPLARLNSRGSAGSTKKEFARKEKEMATRRYDELRMQMEEEEDGNLFSWNKIKLTRDLFQAKMNLDSSIHRLNDASIIEPDKSLLRMDVLNQKVGLTKEGGICCKVSKGFSIEYHILGRFGVAATTITTATTTTDDDDDDDEKETDSSTS